MIKKMTFAANLCCPDNHPETALMQKKSLAREYQPPRQTPRSGRCAALHSCSRNSPRPQAGLEPRSSALHEHESRFHVPLPCRDRMNPLPGGPNPANKPWRHTRGRKRELLGVPGWSQPQKPAPVSPSSVLMLRNSSRISRYAAASSESTILVSDFSFVRRQGCEHAHQPRQQPMAADSHPRFAGERFLPGR